MDSQMSEDAIELYKAENAQAWNHYRHLETTRTQYLTIFFTAYLGATGFVVNLIKNDGKSIAPSVLFGVAVLIFVLFCFSTVFYISVVRVGLVLSLYSDVLQRTQNHFFGDATHAARTWRFAARRSLTAATGLFGIQAAAQAIIAFFSLCLVVAQAFTTYLLFGSLPRTDFRTYLALASALAMTCVLGWLLRKTKQAEALSQKQRKLAPEDESEAAA